MESMNKSEAAIEAILFTMGNSVELSRIADAIGEDKETTRKLIRHLMDSYREEGRGIQIIELEQSYQMCTNKEYYDNLIRIAMHPQKPVLTDVMLETLSIIAYKQPVTKAEIEKIRGVKCDHAVNKLVEYELVKNLGVLTLREDRYFSVLQRNFSARSAYRPWMNFPQWILSVSKTLRQRLKKKYK